MNDDIKFTVVIIIITPKCISIIKIIIVNILLVLCSKHIDNFINGIYSKWINKSNILLF